MGARAGISEQYSLVRDRWMLDFSCVGGGAAANPTSVKTAGGIASIVYSAATGKYTITLADKWTAFLGADFCVIDSAGNAHYEVTVVSETVASTKTVVIQVWGAATATAPALKDLPTTATLKGTIKVTNTQQKPAPF